jgi:hypothetical protein
MKRVLLFQGLLLAIGAVALYWCGPQQAAASYILGGFIVGGNFILLGSAWKMIFNKKQVALSVLIIVFKYAILGVIIYVLVNQKWLSPFWFAAGIASMMMASLVYGLTLGLFENETKE